MSNNKGFDTPEQVPDGACGQPTECYSRVCGYFRPIKNWNKGKKEEFKDRKTFKIGNKKEHMIRTPIIVARSLVCSLIKDNSFSIVIPPPALSGSGSVKPSMATLSPSHELRSLLG